MADAQSPAMSASPGSPDEVRYGAEAGSGAARRRRARSSSSAAADAPSRQRARRQSAAPADDPERDDPESVARLICLRLLTAAPRTQAELATALRRRGVPDDAAAAVLARFEEVKLIDDATFARAWVESRHHSRGLAGRALGAELRRKGVAQDDVAAALGELNPEREVRTARDLVDRRLPGTAGLPGPARMRKLIGVLARKGYPPALAYRVAREALEHEAAHTGKNAEYLADMAEPDYDEEADADHGGQ
jgi:regulatory protein